MGRQRNDAPVIIKRRKVVSGGGHRGGAWKVAYADFVTAMMAFFLLMWLLNATTESQRKGLADYFSPSPPIYRISGGGDGPFGGENVNSDEQIAGAARGGASGGSDGLPEAELQERGTVAPDTPSAEGEEVLAALEAALLAAHAGDSMDSALMLRHVATRITDEGLIVELFDLPGAPLFEGESDRPRPALLALLGVVAEVFAPVGNGIAIEAHSRSLPVVLAGDPVWDLTTARAHRVRTVLEGAGINGAGINGATPDRPALAADRLRRVTGHADRRPAVADPTSARNNRVEVILLRPPR